MLDLGNHLDQWSLKAATDLEPAFLLKKIDVFLECGNMVTSASEFLMFKLGDVIVVLPKVMKSCLTLEVCSGLGMVNEEVP